MRNRIRRVVVLVCLLAILVGCNIAEKNHASLQHVLNCDGSQDYYSLGIHKPTNKLVMGRESGLHFAVLFYGFRLPTEPRGQAIYSATTLSFEPYMKDYPPDYSPKLASGTILVDLNQRKATVNLMTPNGEFRGNGEYPFDCTPDCDRFNDPCDCSEYKKQHGIN